MSYPKSSGQVPSLRLLLGDDQNAYHYTYFSSQVFFDAPLYDHASHLGFSVNEINPKFALQNAPSNLYPTPAPTTAPYTTGLTAKPIMLA